MRGKNQYPADKRLASSSVMKCSIVTLQSVRAGTDYAAQSSANLPGTNCKYIFILIKESGPTDKPLSDRHSHRTETSGKRKRTVKKPRQTSVSLFNRYQVFFFVYFFFTAQSLTRLSGTCDPSPTQTVKEFCLADSAKLQNPRASLMTICSAETSLTPAIITPDQNA